MFSGFQLVFSYELLTWQVALSVLDELCAQSHLSTSRPARTVAFAAVLPSPPARTG
jgi:hypothetical protein